jgi:hypothetical protein
MAEPTARLINRVLPSGWPWHRTRREARVGAASADGSQRDGSQPDGSQPDGARPDEARPGGAQPDEARPDGAQPDEAQPDGAQPDEAQPDEAQSGPSAQSRGRRRAAGIYGTIITAAILAAAGDHLASLPLAISVVVTLLVYWAAEEYAELLGEQVEGGRLPTWPHVRAALAATWPMVTASYLPLLALALTRLAGVSASGAANAGLIVAVVLLVIHAWWAGRAAHLRGRQLLVITSVAGGLGLLMVLLKDVVLIYLH